jgi:eukaryotic-like serine/threonine-protein kinase
MAYLAMHQGSEVAVEFQKIFNQRSQYCANEPIGALAYLGPNPRLSHARRHRPSKDRLSGFLTLWRDADPDIPILKQATAEYAKLQ